MKTLTVTGLVLLLGLALPGSSQTQSSRIDNLPYEIYPLVLDVKPNLPSPFTGKNGEDYVIAVTSENKYAIIAVTVGNDREICRQLITDSVDFPELAATGLHTEASLDNIQSITGRSLAEITTLGRPGGLSQDGFLADDENILAVIKGDNRLVKKMDLTHPQLAKPLFHVLNMMDTDLKLGRWNMARHKWENIQYFYYNGQQVFVEAEDTKGGQQSIFNDSIEGAFYIKLWHQFDSTELQFLKKRYANLSDPEFNELMDRLGTIHTGEMEPQYIMRYGFYEGHTYWRADPVAIAFIFGLKDLTELDTLFDHDLHTVLTGHYTQHP